MGVRRGVEMALDAPRRFAAPIYTFGPLIHNPQVLEILSEKGICVLHDIPQRRQGTVLIRAHGVPPQIKDALCKAGMTVVDATCPRVIKVQTIIAKYAREGYAAIIIGDQDHPEVIGLLGYGGGQAYAVSNLSELEALPAVNQAIVVAQTTQNTEFFNQVRQWAQSHHPQWKIFNTICDSTEKRQAEVKRVAQQVDALVVVGGRDSGNTRRLVEIARQAGKSAFHVETEAELDTSALAGFRLIGVTAGASTPHWIIRRVCRKLENLTPDQHRSWRGMLHALRRALLMTQLYVSIGAGSLCYACAGLYGVEAMGRYALIAFLYVLLMHIVNNLTGQKTARYTDPDKAAFYCRYRWPLALLAGLSGIGGLWAAWGAGLWVFSTLLVMSILGLLYDVRVLPTRMLAGRSLKIKSIPGSKTILISVAWGVVAAVLPTVAAPFGSWPATAVVFVWATGIVFIRTAFFDILDLQTDRIVGKETLATLLGEKRTLKLLYGVAVVGAVLIIGACAGGLAPSWGCLLAVAPMAMLVILRGYAHGRFLPGMELEFWVETQFIFVGLLALAARLI